MPVMHSVYREAGTARIDPRTCIRCGACTQICPAEMLVLGEQGIQIRTDSPFGCIACGHCMMVCPTGAVTVEGRGLSPADLQPAPDPASRAGAAQLAALMQARRSVRRFTEREVDAAVLQRIVEMASTAPMGIPPWDVGCVTVRGRDAIRPLAGEVVRGYEGFLRLFRPWTLMLMRPFVRKATYDMMAHFVAPLARTYVRGWREGHDFVFYDAPALLLFYHSPYTEAADAVIACTYAMLAAESFGLGSTMIGGAPPMLQRNPALCRRLGIPPGHKPAIALVLGHPAVQFHKTIRRRFLGERGAEAVEENP